MTIMVVAVEVAVLGVVVTMMMTTVVVGTTTEMVTTTAPTNETRLVAM